MSSKCRLNWTLWNWMPKINKYPDKNRRYTNMLCSTKENQTCLFNSFKMDLDQLKMLLICTLHQIVCFLLRNLYRSLIIWTKIGCFTHYDRLMIHSQIVYIITIKQKRYLFDRWIKSICSISNLSFLLDWLSRQPQKWKCWYTNRM